MVKFEIGQRYNFTDWFTAGSSIWVVKSRTDKTVTFTVYSHEPDGDSEREETLDVKMTDTGTEFVVLYTYKEHDACIFARPHFDEVPLANV